MTATACGLDFGTSNSTFGLVSAAGEAGLVPLEQGEITLPSVLFFSFEDDRLYVGRAALNEYVSGADGRLMRSIKSLLGTALMDDDTRIKARRVPFTEILTLFLKELVARGAADENAPGNVVVGRPVHFVDDNPLADAEAERQLHGAVAALGFKNIAFQFEPIAAALDYEQHVRNEELAMVADIGGGTSDFTIVRLSPGRADDPDRDADILATGGVHVGGTDFDRLLSMAEIMPMLGLHSRVRGSGRALPVGPYYDLATWHRINRLYASKAAGVLRDMRREAAETDKLDRLTGIIEGRYGHALAARVEEAKIGLSDAPEVDVLFEQGGVSLQHRMTREQLADAIAVTVERIPGQMRETLRRAGVRAGQVDTIITTGGSTRIGLVHQGLKELFPQARFVSNDAFGSVGTGLTLDAGRRFR